MRKGFTTFTHSWYLKFYTTSLFLYTIALTLQVAPVGESFAPSDQWSTSEKPKLMLARGRALTRNLAAAYHIPLPPPPPHDSEKATLSSFINHTAASQASTTLARGGPCKGILIGSDFALAFEFFPVLSPLVEENEKTKDSASLMRYALPPRAASPQQTRASGRYVHNQTPLQGRRFRATK